MAEVDDLFRAALGLAEPWQVTRTAFDATARRLDLYLILLAKSVAVLWQSDSLSCLLLAVLA
jgi:hypothetical protein